MLAQTHKCDDDEGSLSVEEPGCVSSDLLNVLSSLNLRGANTFMTFLDDTSNGCNCLFLLKEVLQGSAWKCIRLSILDACADKMTIFECPPMMMKAGSLTGSQG